MSRAYYNCKTEIDKDGATAYRISKFDADLNVEASYLIKTNGGLISANCECPAGHRPTCRHRQMLPKFVKLGYTSGQAFYDFEQNRFFSATNEADIERSLASAPDFADPYALHEQANDLLNDLTPDTLERSQATAPAPTPTLPETFPPSGLIRRL
jgi:hypothetical protein